MIGGGFPSGRIAVSIWSHALAGPFIMKARFFLWYIYKFSRPHPSRSVPRPDGQSGVLLHRFVPRIVLGTVQGYIVFVRCWPARCREWFGIRSNRMPQLPGSAFNNFEDLFAHEIRRPGTPERRGKHVGKSALVRVKGIAHWPPKSSCHRGINDAGLDNGDTNAKHFHLLSQCLAWSF